MHTLLINIVRLLLIDGVIWICSSFIKNSNQTGIDMDLTDPCGLILFTITNDVNLGLVSTSDYKCYIIRANLDT